MTKRTKQTETTPAPANAKNAPTIVVANSPMFCAVLAQFRTSGGAICAEAWSWGANRPGVARVAYTIEEPHAQGYGIEPEKLLHQSAQNWIEREAMKLGVHWRDVGYRPIEASEIGVLLRLTLDAPGLVEVVELESTCDELEALCGQAVERSGTIEMLEVAAK